MAKVTIEALVCDLCPEEDRVPAVDTVTVVTSRGTQFDNDVCADHDAILRAGRRHTNPNGRGRGAKKATKKKAAGARRTGRPRGVSNNDIREWAASAGLDVAPRGAVPKAIIEAYREAN